MKQLWKCDGDRLVCRWSGVGEHKPYAPAWMQETGNVKAEIAAPAFMDFTRLSPFGGLGWLVIHASNLAR
jgi:hypothetical protein